MSESLFSEAWHRVAKSRAQLHPEAEIRRHRFRGNLWYVVRDPLSNQFARLAPSAYFFACRLRLNRTIEHIWRECLQLYPDDAPTQQEVIQLLAQLTQLNLLSSDLPPDATMSFRRQQKTEGRELQGKLVNFLFFRTHLVDPSPLLDALLPWFRPVLSRFGLILWSVVILAALKIVVEHWREITDQSNGLFAPSNLFLIYVAAIITKFWHELGHGLVCRRFGGEVRSLGLMMLIFTPLPFVDVSSSWAFPRRYQRMLVGGAGMIFEFFLAALATFFWVSTTAGPLNALAYNIMVLSSLTTLLFNINPLLRFDGYYIFSDWAEIPNLGQRSLLQLKYLLEHYVFRIRHSLSPAQSPAEGRWLWIYGITSGLYRIFLIWTIFFVLAGQFLGVGLVLAFIVVVLWIGFPLGKMIRYLARDPLLDRCRPRAVGICVGAFAAVVLFLALVPMPHHFRAAGIVEADVSRDLYTQSTGYLDEIVAPSGSTVHAGDVLLRLTDPLMDLRIQQARAEVRGGEITVNNLADDSLVAAKSARMQLDSARDDLQDLLEQQKNFEVRSPIDGVWVAPDLTDRIGYWMPRGSALGEVVQPGRFRFAAVVEQAQAADLFAGPLRSAQVRLRGQSDIAIKTESIRIIPSQQRILPSAALGWLAGGDIDVVRDDTSGLTALKPFFEVYAELDPSTPACLAQRRTGVIRFNANWEPLLTQGLRRVRQLFQEKIQ
jgi:putative peptide zinc metalloprotease protein